MTLLEELQARIQAKSGSGKQSRPISTPIPLDALRPTEGPSGARPDTAGAPAAKELRTPER